MRYNVLLFKYPINQFYYENIILILTIFCTRLTSLLLHFLFVKNLLSMAVTHGIIHGPMGQHARRHK
jgi:hypothetical protein